MSLTIAYNIARQGLASTALATSVASRNISNASDPNAARKDTIVVGNAIGGIRFTALVGAIDSALFERSVQTGSAERFLDAVARGLERLSSFVGDPQSNASPAAQIGRLRDALQLAAASPEDGNAARSAIAAASEVVAGLRSAFATVQDVRQDANAAIIEGTARLGSLLAEFGEVNDRIVQASATGREVTDDVDQRNALIRDIAALVDVRPMLRERDDMTLFLANGITLFESGPREVAVVGNMASLPGQSGPPIHIDGVELSSASDLGGSLGGLLELRDGMAVIVGRQLDELARGLIAATAEYDQAATPVLAGITGLFTYPGGPSVPSSPTLVDGLAGSISVNPSVDPQLGGNPLLLRDGGIGSPGNPAYLYNATGASGYSGRLRGLIAALAAPQSFAPAAQLASDVGAIEFASSSVGWIEGERSRISAGLEDARIVNDRTVAAWQNRVGVNVDDEMATLISLQRSYQASTRIISAVDQMLNSLFEATR